MPELPEVETVRRGLLPAMEGKRIVRVETRRKDLRFPFPANFNQRLEGARVKAVGRRAKYLVGELSTGEALIMHLGMTGRFTVAGKRPGRFAREEGASDKHDHVVFDMEGGRRITFNDARRFGLMDLWPANKIETYPAFDGLGPEPVSNSFSAAYLEEAFEDKKAPVKAALLDQKVVAGLGNIYVCEALFRARISPSRLAGSIRRERLDRLAAAVREVIEEAIAAGGSTISDFASASGELGYFQHRFRVYDREGKPCPACRKPIRRLVQSGRSSFYCGTCQR
jgi:formamidopyrimidine-DNA glycosylase